MVAPDPPDMEKRADFTIRPARIDDVDALSALGRQLNESQGDPTGPFPSGGGARTRVRQPSAHPGVRRRPRAASSRAMHRTRRPINRPGRRPAIYLCDLFVAPPYRRRGIARALVAAVANRAKAEGCVYLWWASKPRSADAHAFYRTLGASQGGGVRPRSHRRDIRQARRPNIRAPLPCRRKTGDDRRRSEGDVDGEDQSAQRHARRAPRRRKEFRQRYMDRLLRSAVRGQQEPSSPPSSTAPGRPTTTTTRTRARSGRDGASASPMPSCRSNGSIRGGRIEAARARTSVAQVEVAHSHRQRLVALGPELSRAKCPRPGGSSCWRRTS